MNSKAYIREYLLVPKYVRALYHKDMKAKKRCLIKK